MSSNAPATAEVRTFPNAKVQPSTEAPEVPVQPAPAAPVEAPAKKKRSLRSMLLPIIGLGLLSAGSWYGYNYWAAGRFMISTDDAYVEADMWFVSPKSSGHGDRGVVSKNHRAADMSFVSPKISGYVDRVLVSENQRVKAGDPLFVIDDGDYRIAVAQAEAQIATLAKTLDRIDAQTKAAQASLTQAQAQKIADQAAADNAARAQDRAAQLLKSHVGTQAQLDDAQTALDQAKAALAGADAQIAAAQANIGVLEAQRAE